MDFARKQLEKYGWTDGKGLGKNENGISEALKPKLKRSVTGIGYDAAADITEQWWSTLYDKAAKNVQVEEENGKTKKMKRVNDTFEITNSMWRLNRKNGSDNTEEYSEFFVRTAVLGSGGSETTKVKDSDSEDDTDRRDARKLTDEELYAACEGRTAHKGARHGLRALGKLARIEQQEKQLLQQEKYNAFKAKNKSIDEDQVVEDTSLFKDAEVSKKKKKKKRCKSNTSEINGVTNECNDNHINDNVDNECNEKINNNEINESEGVVKKDTKKKKKSKKKDLESVKENSSDLEPEDLKCDNECNNEVIECDDIKEDSKKKKKSKKKDLESVEEVSSDVEPEDLKCDNECDNEIIECNDIKEDSKKKKKSKKLDIESDMEVSSNIETDLKYKKKRKHSTVDGEEAEVDTDVQIENLSKKKKKKKTDN